MHRTRLAVLAALAVSFLGAAAPAQEAVEALFYRGYFAERELQRPEQALALYREVLDLAPRHRIAGQAARRAIALLRKAGDDRAAEALAERHARVLQETVPAGINAAFVDPAADVSDLVGRFESESREVFAHRHEIVDLLDLEEGESVADIGAGTGFFTNLFAREVGEEGKVWAVEIGPVLLEHLRELEERMNLPQIEVVRAEAESSRLPPESVDVAFVCDTYHHFTHPHETLESLYRALRPGGRLFVVEFERIPGKSRGWILDHVRAGEEVFRAEIEEAGFELARREETPWLEETYVLRFTKPGAR